MKDRIVSYLEDHLPAYLDDLRYLAGIDSGSYEKAGVDRVQDWFQEQFTAAGFDVRRVPQTDFGDDLIAVRRSEGSRRAMLLGHADTVYPLGTAAARPVTIHGEKVMGPGTCDMKAGLLTGLYAVRALDVAGWSGLGELTFVIVSDEEIGERHSVELLKEQGRRQDAVLTLEAARENGDIVTSRKAGCWYTVNVTGKAAHAGVEPHKGRSATLALGHILVETFKLNAMKAGMTVNPGEISGGRAPNVVADTAHGHFDLRAWSNDDLETLAAAFERVASQPYVPDVSVRVTRDSGSGCPAMEYSAGVRALESAAKRLAGELDFSVEGAATGGGSDISYAGEAGTPGLDGLGPVGGLDHSPDEYILLNSIVPRTALLALLLKEIEESEELAYAERSN
jgi:glutamate carboxypeptidase